jgi:hypothetical protein
MGNLSGWITEMNLLGRLWKAVTDDYPDVPDSADLDEGESCEDEPGIDCRWIEVSVRCKSPINEGENMPAGCDARCPARLQVEQRAHERTRENNERMFF